MTWRLGALVNGVTVFPLNHALKTTKNSPVKQLMQKDYYDGYNR
jgi:hypothetical protein